MGVGWGQGWLSPKGSSLLLQLEDKHGSAGLLVLEEGERLAGELNFPAPTGKEETSEALWPGRWPLHGLKLPERQRNTQPHLNLSSL